MIAPPFSLHASMAYMGCKGKGDLSLNPPLSGGIKNAWINPARFSRFRVCIRTYEFSSVFDKMKWGGIVGRAALRGLALSYSFERTPQARHATDGSELNRRRKR